jgi:hypothetical protein
MTPAQLLAMALVSKGVSVTPWVIEEAASLAGVGLTCSTAKSVADHIARHASLSKEVSP